MIMKKKTPLKSVYKERVGIHCNKTIIIYNTNEEAICSKRGEKIEKKFAQKQELVE